MGRAKSVSELLATKIETFPFRDEWYDAFGEPERRGVWIVWGNLAFVWEWNVLKDYCGN